MINQFNCEGCRALLAIFQSEKEVRCTCGALYRIEWRNPAQVKSVEYVLEAEVERQVQICNTRIAEIQGHHIAIQARWDGDTGGWFVEMELVVRKDKDRLSEEEPNFLSRSLTFLRCGGDIRVFQGIVPPWDEALIAQRVGRRLAEQKGIPFYFPSPYEPFDDVWGDFCPKPLRRIQGTLEYPNGSPASDVSVELYETEISAEGRRKIGSLTTDQKGRFKFPKVISGEYIVVAGMAYRYLTDQISTFVKVRSFGF